MQGKAVVRLDWESRSNSWISSVTRRRSCHSGNQRRPAQRQNASSVQTPAARITRAQDCAGQNVARIMHAIVDAGETDQ